MHWDDALLDIQPWCRALFWDETNKPREENHAPQPRPGHTVSYSIDKFRLQGAIFEPSPARFKPWPVTKLKRWCKAMVRY